MGEGEGRSLVETPTWAVATVVLVMVTLGFFFQGSLKQFGKWLDRTKRKALLAALDKIKEELMLFGLLSLLMGHWIIFVAKICVKSSVLSSRFYPCLPRTDMRASMSLNHFTISSSSYVNYSVSREQVNNVHNGFCSEGHDSFASYESLEQLHRFLFVLGVTHVAYSFFAIALATIKIYSWRKWENQATSMALQELQGSPQTASSSVRMTRLMTFISHNTSHPWSQHRVLVWLLCFSRQFWSSINRADYMALRLGFITTHQLSLSYDFHNYMLRSIEDEFCDIVGISVPLWIFTVLCIFLDFHGTNIYFWLSFLPVILVLVIGTKLHRIVVKLAVEIMDRSPWTGIHHFNLRDELFWLGSPRLLLRLIQFISFQNALEMAMFVWSLWESKGPSCFMENHRFIVIRLTFGLISQFWCSFITFPLYVIVTQMGSRFKKSIVSENVRKSLHGWQRKVKARHGGPPFTHLTATTSTTSLDSVLDEIEIVDAVPSTSGEGSSSICEDTSMVQNQIHEISPSDEKLKVPFCEGPQDSYDDSSDEHSGDIDVNDSSCIVPLA
ncbi:MLO-like protein 4 [Actinidia eriantha]|uniref:MLO-like protein 4 n=1 Tax=Actinidia eriantha TaxID=165200 RepID=UPI00258D1CA1|nr:MLO-like protein 4 [Actinidia eriantha]